MALFEQLPADVNLYICGFMSTFELDFEELERLRRVSKAWKAAVEEGLLGSPGRFHKAGLTRFACRLISDQQKSYPGLAILDEAGEELHLHPLTGGAYGSGGGPEDAENWKDIPESMVVVKDTLYVLSESKCVTDVNWLTVAKLRLRAYNLATAGGWRERSALLFDEQSEPLSPHAECFVQGKEHTNQTTLTVVASERYIFVYHKPLYNFYNNGFGTKSPQHADAQGNLYDTQTDTWRKMRLPKHIEFSMKINGCWYGNTVCMAISHECLYIKSITNLLVYSLKSDTTKKQRWKQFRLTSADGDTKAFGVQFSTVSMATAADSVNEVSILGWRPEHDDRYVAIIVGIPGGGKSPEQDSWKGEGFQYDSARGTDASSQLQAGGVGEGGLGLSGFGVGLRIPAPHLGIMSLFERLPPDVNLYICGFISAFELDFEELGRLRRVSKAWKEAVEEGLLGNPGRFHKAGLTKFACRLISNEEKAYPGLAILDDTGGELHLHPLMAGAYGSGGGLEDAEDWKEIPESLVVVKNTPYVLSEPKCPEGWKDVTKMRLRSFNLARRRAGASGAQGNLYDTLTDTWRKLRVPKRISASATMDRDGNRFCTAISDECLYIWVRPHLAIRSLKTEEQRWRYFTPVSSNGAPTPLVRSHAGSMAIVTGSVNHVSLLGWRPGFDTKGRPRKGAGEVVTISTFRLAPCLEDVAPSTNQGVRLVGQSVPDLKLQADEIPAIIRSLED
ncbi:hypothetical protein KFL_004700020 [Klebsormidium nitens]|uniref:F-box domain-containing protein n=1 Tax=Klebsormidium nitens TaxID=105231 RepID=A0A1Y1IDC4_KLENI|nr:hypothetical protein KFL_004700020 [Klebsormidium nitens]|eukprot:GAQ88920.1 hypothetical protein KFL_004700020 [Klebsormidium nitens]